MSVTVKPEKSLRIHYRKSKPWGLNSCDYTSALSRLFQYRESLSEMALKVALSH